MRALAYTVVVALSTMLFVSFSSAQQISPAVADPNSSNQTLKSTLAVVPDVTVAQATLLPSIFGGSALNGVPRIPANEPNSVNIFGLEQTSLGNAILTISDNTLVVSNIGTSGNDGVLVTLPPNPTYMDAIFTPMNAKSYKPGSYFTMTNIGTINGVGGQAVASGTATRVGSHWFVTVDFSPVTSGPLLATYSLKGAIVGTETITNPPKPTVARGWTLSGSFDDWGPDVEDPNSPLFICYCPTQQLTLHNAEDILSPLGNVYYSDALDISAITLNSNVAFTGTTAASYTASGISTFTITAEPYTVNNGGAAIYNNFGEPFTMYQQSGGTTVSGSATLGTSAMVGNAFTPNSNVTVGELDVAVGSISGTNSYNVGIYNDSGGVPGEPLAVITEPSTTPFGTCCGLVTFSGINIALTAGTQYWVVVGPTSTSSNTIGVWNFINTSSCGCNVGNVAINNGGGWVSVEQIPNAYDVLTTPSENRNKR